MEEHAFNHFIVILTMMNVLEQKLFPVKTYCITAINSHSLTFPCTVVNKTKKCSLSCCRETTKHNVLHP